jgi:hypothetical protein
MTFAIISSGIIFVLGIFLFITSMGKMLPIGIKLLPFISVAILWIETYFFTMQDKGGVLKVLLLIAFWILVGVFVFPVGAGNIVFSFLDMEKVLPPEIIGDPSRKDKICFVYHPGMSDFTITNIRTCALKLSEKGYSVTIASAHKRLQVIIKNYKALVFSSPVYAGTARPPLTRFIETNDLSGTKCFLLLTGGGSSTAATELDKASKLIAKSNGSVSSSIKAAQDQSDEDRRRNLESFAANIALSM